MIQNREANNNKAKAVTISFIASLFFLTPITGYTQTKQAQKQKNDQTDKIKLQVTDEKIFNQPISKEVITKETIENKQAATTPKALAHSPGVYFQQPFHGSGSLLIRGVNGQRTPIFIDGVRYSNGIYGNFPNQYLSTISPHILKNASITRGTSPFSFGKGAIGGVINLNTADIADDSKFHGTGKYLYQSGDHTSGISTDGTVSSKIYSFLAGADYTSFGQIRAGGGFKDPFSNLERSNWRVKLKLKPEDSPLSVTGTYIGHYTNNAMRTDQLGLGKITAIDNSDHLVILGLDFDPLGVIKKLRIRASYHQMSQRQNGTVCSISGGHNIIDYPACASTATALNAYKYAESVDTFGLLTSSRINLAHNRVIISGDIEYYFDNIISANTQLTPSSSPPPSNIMLEQSRGVYSSGSYFSKFGVYLFTDTIPIKTKAGDLHIGVGGRFSNTAAYAPTVPEKNEDIHYTNSNFSTSASISWLIKNIFNFYGTFSSASRTPDLQESSALGYVANWYYVPNAKLRPEESYNFEIGSKLNIKPVEVSLAWFHNTISNYIDEQPGIWNGRYVTSDGVHIVQHVNSDSAVFKGFESKIAVHMFDITLSGNISWVQGEITDKNRSSYFEQMVNYATTYPARRMPSLFGSGSIKYNNEPHRFYTEFFVNWADSQNRLHPMDKLDLSMCETGYHSGKLNDKCSNIKGWYTLNLRGGYKITPNATIELAALNLSDNKYKPAGSGIYATGFDARGSLIINF